MIFERHSEVESEQTCPTAARTAVDVLSACVAEAERHANAISQMDRAIGAALENGSGAIDAQTLQTLDLLRQEAEGLARALNLATSMPSPDTVIDAEAMTRCVPVAAQRARFMS